MKILILGAGQVGITLAENLAQETFDITIVDNDPSKLVELRDRLDIQTVEGQASHATRCIARPPKSPASETQRFTGATAFLAKTICLSTCLLTQKKR